MSCPSCGCDAARPTQEHTHGYNDTHNNGLFYVGELLPGDEAWLSRSGNFVQVTVEKVVEKKNGQVQVKARNGSFYIYEKYEEVSVRRVRPVTDLEVFQAKNELAKLT